MDNDNSDFDFPDDDYPARRGLSGKTKKIIIGAVIAVIILAILITVLVVVLNKKKDGSEADSDPSNTTESQVYIVSIEPIEGGFLVVYSDGSSKEFLYPEQKQPEEPEGKVYVVSISQSNGDIIIMYSDGSAGVLKMSSQSGDSSTSSGSTSQAGRYVTMIYDDEEGNIVIKYSNGATEVIKKDDIVIEEDDTVYITKVEQTSTGIKVTYSDGTSGNITSVGDLSVSLSDIYASYKEYYSTDISLEDFLKSFLTVESTIADPSELVAANRLRSAVKISTEFIEGANNSPATQIFSGSGVIWKINNDYTYIVTNYHVVFDMNANVSLNGGSYIAHGIYASIYGNEHEVTNTGSGYSYGSAFKCEYVGGAITVDLAVIRVSTATIKAINPGIQAIECAETYHVGETAIAIGNPKGWGISVSKGVVSVESEYVNFQIDQNVRSYRCMRIDTAIYGGSSGGGLYNVKGQLIGITNGGNGESEQNINYAIPVQIVKGVADSIIANAVDNNSATKGLYTMNLGGTVTATDTRYVYDPATGYGKIREKVVISSISANPANTLFGLFALTVGDAIRGIQINGVQYKIDRIYDLTEVLYHVTVGSSITIQFERNGTIQNKTVSDILFTQLKTVS